MSDPVRETCATVIVGCVETTYLRVGDGPPMVVLGAAGDDPDARACRLAQYTGLNRVILPLDLPMGPSNGSETEYAAFSAWLAGFIEGLGLEQPVIVAPAELAERVDAFQSLHPGVVSRIEIRPPG